MPPRLLFRMTTLTLMAGLLLTTALASPAFARCTVTLRADGNTAAIQRAMDAPGRRTPVVCLKPGIYKGARLIATRSVVLKRVGKGRAVFDAGGRGRVLTVMGEKANVTLQGLTLTNGSSEEGGAAAVIGGGTLRIVGGWITANQGTRKGGAVWVKAGKLELVQTRVSGNRGGAGGAVYVSDGGTAKIASSLISDNKNATGNDGPLHIRSGATLLLLSSTLAYNSGQGVYVEAAKGTQTPAAVRIESSVIMGTPDAVRISRKEAANVAVFRSVLYGGVGFIPLDLDSSRLLPVFNLTDTERYRPTFGSPAIGIGSCTDRDTTRDVAGNKRGRRCTAGALESTRVEIKKTMKARKKVQKSEPEAQPWSYPEG